MYSFCPRFQVLTAVSLEIPVLWNVTLHFWGSVVVKVLRY